MNPQQHRAMSTQSSVQYVGTRDPSSTLDFCRRSSQQGVVDLTTRDNKRRQVFSVPGGKRQKQVQTINTSTLAYTTEEKWSEGAFRWVHKGVYGNGPQHGQSCVLKEFKTGSVYETSFFDKDIKAVEKAAEIIESFNQLNSTFLSGYKKIHLNRPAVWQEIYPDSTGKHKKKLVEPMLEGDFLKFNSNSGYTNGAEFLQALSHFSYHTTEGNHLLCDLQGGHYEDSYVLTDPVIMSSDNSKTYGSGDLGSEGIGNFFAYHVCGRFCQRHWRKPTSAVRSQRIPRMASTSFSLMLGTVQSEADRKKKLHAILAKANKQTNKCK